MEKVIHPVLWYRSTCSSMKSYSRCLTFIWSSSFWQRQGGFHGKRYAPSCTLISINVLLDKVLLEIFDFHMKLKLLTKAKSFSWKRGLYSERVEGSHNHILSINLRLPTHHHPL
jgi:hypothetical protein